MGGGCFTGLPRARDATARPVSAKSLVSA